MRCPPTAQAGTRAQTHKYVVSNANTRSTRDRQLKWMSTHQRHGTVRSSCENERWYFRNPRKSSRVNVQGSNKTGPTEQPRRRALYAAWEKLLRQQNNLYSPAPGTSACGAAAGKAESLAWKHRCQYRWIIRQVETDKQINKQVDEW